MPRGTHKVASVVHGTLSPCAPRSWLDVFIREGKDDGTAIRSTVARFIQGWLEGDGARMESCLHPDLEKRLLRLGEPLGPRKALARMRPLMEAEALEVVTDVLDVRHRMACAISRVGPWTAYVHLGRAGRRWTIVNMLWEWQ